MTAMLNINFFVLLLFYYLIFLYFKIKKTPRISCDKAIYAAYSVYQEVRTTSEDFLYIDLEKYYIFRKPSLLVEG
jgi:hypothetical protein